MSSPLYAAPELSSKDCYTESVDIWGLGIILFCMLSGISKFVDCKDKLHGGDSSVLQNIDNEYESLLVKMLSITAESRPSITELVKMMA